MVEEKPIYKDLSYKVVGAAQDVHNKIGGRPYEKHIQKAMAEALKINGLQFIREQQIVLRYQNAEVGTYFPDFIVDDKIVVEIKRGHRFEPAHFDQVKAYLQVSGLKLGIILLFTPAEVRFQRVLNIH